MDVESSRLEVRAAKLNFLRAALLRDQITIAMVKDVPDKVKVLEHKKTVEHRMEQVKQGEKAVAGYMDKYLRVVHVDKPELAHKEMNTYAAMVVTS